MNALHNFLNYLTNERQASAHTTDNYQRDILQFADMVLGGSQNWQSVGTDQARQFVIKLQEKKLARNSVLRKISSLRSFFRFMLREEIVDTNPFVGLASIKKEQNLPKFMTINEIDSLSAIPQAYWDKAIDDKTAKDALIPRILPLRTGYGLD